jgi:thymidine phosphorylase
MPGTLFLVVGPSGAGKDTLLDGARRALGGDERYVFARRVITRPADAGGEEHEAVSTDESAKRRARGDFMAWWNAHDLDYGLARGLLDELAAGRHVVANVSRGAIGDIAGRAANVRVIEVTAPPEILAARLENRGREEARGVARRLARKGADVPPGIPVATVMNDGTPEEGIDKFVAALSV